jgi:hypothetical protein
MRTSLIWLLCSSSAWSSGLKGSVSLPSEPKLDATPGLWRVENGVLPVVPRGDLREVLVLLEPDDPPSKKLEAVQTSFELRGVRLDPRLVAVPEGSEITFKNNDRWPHMLFVENMPKLLDGALPPGQSRAKKFSTAGDYQIRDEEFPHVRASLIVVRTPYYSGVDEHGNFRIEAPEGHYTLRVYWRNGWAMQQPINIGAHTTEMAIHVPAKASKK